MNDKVHSRRVVLRMLGGVSGALALSSAVGCGSSGPNCNDTTGVDTTMRTTLHYTPNASDPARRCSNCQLYTGGQNGCGTCQLFPGPVDPNGSCDSFVARS